VPLFGERKREAERRRREAAGDSLWTDLVSSPARIRLWKTVELAASNLTGYGTGNVHESIAREANDAFLFALGRSILIDPCRSPWAEASTFVGRCSEDDLWSLLESAYGTVDRYFGSPAAQMEALLHVVLLSERISVEMPDPDATARHDAIRRRIAELDPLERDPGRRGAPPGI
jgi:hypothetical protein